MLRVIELFGGIGAFSSALDRLKKDYEIVDYVDSDMAATQSYNAIHNTNFSPQDITKWNKDIKKHRHHYEWFAMPIGFSNW